MPPTTSRTWLATGRHVTTCVDSETGLVEIMVSPAPDENSVPAMMHFRANEVELAPLTANPELGCFSPEQGPA